MDRFLAAAIVTLCITAMWLIIYDHLLAGWGVLVVVGLLWAHFTRLFARGDE